MKNKLLNIMLLTIGIVPTTLSAVSKLGGLQFITSKFVVENRDDFFSGDKKEISESATIELAVEFKKIISKFNLAQGDKKKLIEGGFEAVEKMAYLPTEIHFAMVQQMAAKASQSFFSTLTAKEQLKLIEETGCKKGTKQTLTKINLQSVLQGFSKKRVKKIFKKLKEFPRLAHLNLHHNKLDIDVVTAFKNSCKNKEISIFCPSVARKLIF
jgi:hypothetical protein